MIETKIKCDANGYHFGHISGVVNRKMALEEGWYEIQFEPGMIRILKPDAEDKFMDFTNVRHACNKQHAVEVIGAIADEMIPDVERR